MPDTNEADQHTAQARGDSPSGPVTLINSFTVAPGRDKAFVALWEKTSAYFRAQPGFVSVRLHRSISPDATHRFVNMARWASLAAFQAAQRTDGVRHLIAQPEWREFPSSPALYEVVHSSDA